MRFLRFIYSIYAFVLFVAIMLMLFPFIIIASFFGKVKGGNFINRLCILWGDVWFLLIGMHEKILHEEPADLTREYIFVSNHISYLDIPMILKSTRKHNIRILGKAEMAKVPVFGFIYKNVVVMVDRKDAKARTKSMLTLKAVLRKNISVFICPEGTFNMTHAPLKDFYDGAFRIAIETQTPIKPILFLDTYDRLNYKSIFSMTPGKCRAVHLKETKTEGLSLEDMQQLKEDIHKQMSEGLIRYKASWIHSE